MQLNEKLNFERTRDGEIKIARFYCEGKLYGAYEYSAYLASKNTVDGVQPLKVMKHNSKNNGEYVNIGLPLTSFKKYFPNCEMSVESGEYVEITFPDNVAENEFSEWKGGIKLAEPKKQQSNLVSNQAQGRSSNFGIFSLFSDIISFDEKSASHEECVEYITKIKTSIINILK